MPSIRSLALTALATVGLACQSEPPEDAPEGCVGGKCDDAEQQQGACAGVDPAALGCCWIGADAANNDALLCSFSTESVAPAHVHGTLDRFDTEGRFEDRALLSDSDETVVAWSIPAYPFDLRLEVIAERTTDVVGLGRSGVSAVEQVTVERRDAMTEAEPFVVRAPVDVWHADVYNRYANDVALIHFAYQLSDAHHGTLEVKEQRLAAEYGVRESIPVAAPVGATELGVQVELLSPTATSDGERVESKLIGAGPYVLNATGLTALGPDDLRDPVGEAVTSCAVERSTIPAPEDCKADEADPEKCKPEIVDDLVCTVPTSEAVDNVIVVAQGAKPEEGPAPQPVTFVIEPDGTRTRLDIDDYPYTIEIETLFNPELIGLETLDDPSHLATAVLEGPMAKVDVTLPFVAWEVSLAVEPGLFAFVELAPWNVELGYGREDRFSMLARERSLEVFDAPTEVLLAVAPDLDSLEAQVVLDDGSLESENVVVEVQLRPGTWKLGVGGLEDAE